MVKVLRWKLLPIAKTDTHNTHLYTNAHIQTDTHAFTHTHTLMLESLAQEMSYKYKYRLSF